MGFGAICSITGSKSGFGSTGHTPMSLRDLLSQGGKSSHSSPGALYFARDFVKAKDDPEDKDAHDLVNRADSIDEFTITYSKVFLGINVGCISCHDGRGHLEQVNLFLTSKKRSEFFQQAAFYGKTRMIMNWEDGFQANTEYTVDDVVDEGYPTKGESIVRVPRTGGPNQPGVPADRRSRSREPSHEMSWPAFLPPTFNLLAPRPIASGRS